MTPHPRHTLDRMALDNQKDASRIAKELTSHGL